MVLTRRVPGSTLPAYVDDPAVRRNLEWLQDEITKVRRLMGTIVDITMFGGAPGADATAAIEAAIVEAEAAGGGRVVVPYTVYARWVKLRSRVTLAGYGYGSRIVQTASTTGDLVTLADVNVQQAGIVDIVLDGNRTNQTAPNRAVFLDNTGGAFETGDSHHFLLNVILTGFLGSGLVRGPDVRELRAINVLARLCNEYGFDVTAGGGTDNFFALCTAQASGYSGFNCAGYGDRYVGCKAFGNGTRHVSGNGAGYLITGHRQQFAACEAQENWQRGFSFLNAHGCEAVGMNADANDLDGILLDGAVDNRIEAVVQSTGGLAYQTTWALELANAADRNHLELVVRSSELIGGIMPAATVKLDNAIHVNSRYVERTYNQGGAVGGADEHFLFSKAGAPAVGNPYWVAKTDAAAVPLASLQSWDGAAAHTYLEMDHANGEARLPESALVGGGGGKVGFFGGTRRAQVAVAAPGAYTAPVIGNYSGIDNQVPGSLGPYTGVPALLSDAATLIDLNGLAGMFATSAADYAAVADLNALKGQLLTLAGVVEGLTTQVRALFDALHAAAGYNLIG